MGDVERLKAGVMPIGKDFRLGPLIERYEREIGGELPNGAQQEGVKPFGRNKKSVLIF